MSKFKDIMVSVCEELGFDKVEDTGVYERSYRRGDILVRTTDGSADYIFVNDFGSGDIYTYSKHIGDFKHIVLDPPIKFENYLDGNPKIIGGDESVLSDHLKDFLLGLIPTSTDS